MTDNIPDISSIIGSLMANPGAVEGIINILKQNGITPDVAEPAEFVDKKMPPEEEKEEKSEDGLEKRLPPGTKERETLLRAIRPYLSPEKCATLDEILKLSGIIDILRLSGGKKH